MATISAQQATNKTLLLKCTGYNSSFINTKKIGITSMLNALQKSKLPTVEGNKNGILHYTNLSVLYNKERKIPFVSAYNIDGSNKQENIKRTIFRVDPRIDSQFQLNNTFYDLEKKITEFEIGHMCANDEMSWGLDAQMRAYQTFHFPNSVPQAERLNTGIWRSLEQYILKEAADKMGNKKINMFTGPVLNEFDPKYINDSNFQIPLMFFKVIVFEFNNKMYSTAFIMSHEKKLVEDKLLLKPSKRIASVVNVPRPDFIDYTYSEVFQVNISKIEELTGMKFKWTGVTPLVIKENINQIKIISEVSDVDDAKKNLKRIASVKSSVQSKMTTLILPNF